MNEQHSAETVGGALSAATARLRAADLPGPRLDAEVLLGHLLSASRTGLAIHPEQPVDPEIRAQLDRLIERRIAGDPVAYLTGRKEFIGRDFAVGPGVLIPRPETELLVERAVATIERLWPAGPVRVLDICTGSGAVALSVALATDPERIHVTGSDISPTALGYALQNRGLLGLEGCATLVRGDLLHWTDGPWDMILANPPYLRPDQIDGNAEIAAEPRLALDGGVNGLEPIERILEQAVRVVAPRFAMMIEIDPDQAGAARALAAERFPGSDVTIVPDLTGRARFVAIEWKETAP